MARTEKVGQQIAVEVIFDMVRIDVICRDGYAAQVLYDDLVDRLSRGEGITLSVKQEHSPEGISHD